MLLNLKIRNLFSTSRGHFRKCVCKNYTFFLLLYAMNFYIQYTFCRLCKMTGDVEIDNFKEDNPSNKVSRSLTHPKNFLHEEMINNHNHKDKKTTGRKISKIKNRERSRNRHPSNSHDESDHDHEYRNIHHSENKVNRRNVRNRSIPKPQIIEKTRIVNPAYSEPHHHKHIHHDTGGLNENSLSIRRQSRVRPKMGDGSSRQRLTVESMADESAQLEKQIEEETRYR